MKIKKLQSVCLILACVAVTGLIGCGETDKRPVSKRAMMQSVQEIITLMYW